MKISSVASCLSLLLALAYGFIASAQSAGEIDINSYRNFIINLEEHIRDTPELRLTGDELGKVMGLRAELLHVLADAKCFQLVSEEESALLHALNREMVAIIWREGPSPMVELFDSEREINYIFNTRNPPKPSWIAP